MDYINSLLNKIFDVILREAHDARESAGYSGSYGDGGASRLEEQVKFYKYGMIKALPPEWDKYHDQARNEADPEYKEYLRLQNKFNK
jgi:hypothetical protein